MLIDQIQLKWKEDKYILLGFLIPLIIMTGIMIGMQFAPFGPFSLLISDGNAQEIDRITGFRDIILNHKSFYYTWGQLQGSTPFAFINFNPSYLLFLFVSDEHLVDMVTITTILKPAFAGATCAFYLKNTFNKKDISISIFSWCYALMAYGIGFHFILGWGEQLVMLPLALYGIEKILKDRRDYLFFTFTLIAIFFMYYYFGYMTGVFCFLYFIYRYVMIAPEKGIKDFVGKLGSFLLSPILAFGATSFLLIPILYMLTLRDNILNVNNLDIYLRYNWQDFWTKLMVGSFDTYLPDGYPFIYCGLIVTLLIGFYFCSEAVKYREKLLSFYFLVFMFVSLTLNPLYVAWQAFKPPIYFEGRFSYLVSFLMVFMAYRGFCKLHTVSSRQMHLIFLVITLLFLNIRRKDYDFILDENVLYTGLFIGIYFLLMVLLFKTYDHQKKIYKVLAFFVASELLCNTYLILDQINQWSPYPTKAIYNESSQHIQKAVHFIRQQDKSFYRIEFTKHRGMNDGFGQGYPSISHFDSTYNYEVKEAIGDMGIKKGHNWLKYIESTPLLDLLLHIKYIVTPDESYYENYEKIATYERDGKPQVIYRNPYDCSIGWMSQDALRYVENTEDALKLQEEILNKMIGEEHTYYEEVMTKEEVNSKRKDKSYHFNLEATETGCYFMSLEGLKDNDQVELFINHTPFMFKDKELEEVTCIGNFKARDSVDIELRLTGDNFKFKKITFYRLKEALLDHTYKKIKNNQLIVKEASDTLIEGTVVATADKPFLYTSIPYDKGWKLYIDGKRVEPFKMINAFLGVELTAGEHNIKFVYYPIGLGTGIGLTFISWILLIILIIKRVKWIGFSNSEDGKA